MKRGRPKLERKVVPCACGCGKKIADIDSNGMPRKFLWRHRTPGKRRASPEPVTPTVKRCRHCGFEMYEKSPFWNIYCKECTRPT